MSQNITLWGASYSNVPSVNLPKTGGGTASFTDVTDTTAAAADVAQGKYFYTSAGVKTEGTGSGGGGSSVATGTEGATLQSASNSISFTGLNGEPTSFALCILDSISTGASPYKIASVVYDGSNVIGQIITNTNNAQVSYDDTGFSKSYSSGTLTITNSSSQFQAGSYYLAYSYNGSAANIHTEDVQVGSGATSITFTGLEDEPLYFSCIFKSNFSTSSGYQRVICVIQDDEGIPVGMEMDSAAHYSDSHWTTSYNNGSLTITSQGTNAGGYFHQPGYYQLTYVLADASPYQKVSKTYRASTSAQSEKIEPSTGYDAMSEVNISIPAVTQTNLTAANIKSGTTISISNGQSNLWSVTGTYTGGGGSGKNVQAYMGYATRTANSYGATSVTLTVAKAGTYNVSWCAWRGSSSGTMGTNLHVNSTTGTNQQTWTGTYGQCITLTNQTYAANDVLTLYATSGNNSRTVYVGNLIIEEQ